MKTAVSLYLGGEIIECSQIESYEDTRQLGLICPYCKEPVFFRDDFAKTNKSNELYLVSRCFSHYRGTDPGIVSSCEARSITAEHAAYLNKLETKNRNQRLKIFQRYFWEILQKYSPTSRDFNETCNKVASARLRIHKDKEKFDEWEFSALISSYIRDNVPSETENISLGNFLRDNMDLIYSKIDRIIKSMGEKNETWRTGDKLDSLIRKAEETEKLTEIFDIDDVETLREDVEKLKLWYEDFIENKFNANYHGKSCKEVFAFLCTRMAANTLDRLVDLVVYQLVLTGKKMRVLDIKDNTNFLDLIQEEDVTEVVGEVICYTVDFICNIDWAGAIRDKLKQEK